MIKICVIGLGYVGLPILVRLAKKFNVNGFDINQERIEFLKKKIDINNEVKEVLLNKKVRNSLTSKINDCKKSNFFILCIPTHI